MISKFSKKYAKIQSENIPVASPCGQRGAGSNTPFFYVPLGFSEDFYMYNLYTVRNLVNLGFSTVIHYLNQGIPIDAARNLAECVIQY